MLIDQSSYNYSFKFGFFKQFGKFPTKHTEFFKAYIVEALLIRKALLTSRLVLFHFW